MSLYGKDLLEIMDFSSEELRQMLEVAKEFKKMKREGKAHNYLQGKNIAVLFEKTSTRTRCAFEVAAYDLGMNVTYLDPSGSQMGHKESIADTARVLDRFYDGLEFRGYEQKTVAKLARYAKSPVWNGLTDYCHPTQALADFMTIEEHFGKLKGLTIAFVGDTRNNVATSLMAMSAKLGVNFIACGPEQRWPEIKLIEECQKVAKENGASVKIVKNPKKMAGKVDVIFTDVWLSMGAAAEKWGERIDMLEEYRVDKEMMTMAGKETVFMHPLPSFHNLETRIAKEVYEKFGVKEMEVSNEVFESKRSLVFEEAENRMHTIKAVMFLTMYKKEEK